MISTLLNLIQPEDTMDIQLDTNLSAAEIARKLAAAGLTLKSRPGQPPLLTKKQPVPNGGAMAPGSSA